MKRNVHIWRDSGNWEINMFRITQWRKVTLEEILKSEKRSKSNRAGLQESKSGIQVRKVIIWVTEFSRSISSIAIGQPNLLVTVKVSENKYNTRWVDWENLLLDEIVPKACTKKQKHGSSSPPPILGGDVKISDQNNWGGDLKF